MPEENVRCSSADRYVFGTMPLISPAVITMLQLYRRPPYGTGAPTTTVMSVCLHASAILATPSSAPFISRLCLNRSPHVAPVTQSSGNTTSDVRLSFALPIRLHISSALYIVSATFTAGTAAAVRMNP